MSYSNGKIIAPVSVNDVQRAIGSSSGDVGTLCRSLKINKWARYRPVVCTVNNGANNTPKTLSNTQREEERWGFELIADMYGADGIQPFETFINTYYTDDTIDEDAAIKLKAWYNGAFARLTDFVKTDGNGNALDNKGYDHNASPTSVIVVRNYERCQLKPLIPEGERDIYIPAGSRDAIWEFPRDKFWVSNYIDYLNGTLIPTAEDNVEINEEHISILDLISKPVWNAYDNRQFFKRGVMIFRWLSELGVNAYWSLIGRAYDRDDTTNPTIFHRDFNVRPEAFFDLTDSSNTTINNPTGTNPRTIEGEFLFMEYWYYKNIDGGIEEITPLLGFTYKVNIHRTEAPTPVVPTPAYIVDVFTYSNKDSGFAALVVGYSIVFTVYINPDTFLNSGDVIQNGDIPSYAAANARLIMQRMQKHYDSFEVRVGTIRRSLFTDIEEAVAEDYTEGGITWKKCQCLIYQSETEISISGITAEANAMIKQQIGASISGHDELLMTTE